MSTEDDYDRAVEIADSIIDTYGPNWDSRTSYSGIISPDDELYEFVCVVRGQNKTYYDGMNDFDEAQEYASNVITDSVSDPDGEGVWVVIAVVRTSDSKVFYPEYSSRVRTDYPVDLSTL
jgi:hypothetical protein